MAKWCDPIVGARGVTASGARVSAQRVSTSFTGNGVAGLLGCTVAGSHTCWETNEPGNPVMPNADDRKPRQLRHPVTQQPATQQPADSARPHQNPELFDLICQRLTGDLQQGRRLILIAHHLSQRTLDELPPEASQRIVIGSC